LFFIVLQAATFNDEAVNWLLVNVSENMQKNRTKSVCGQLHCQRFEEEKKEYYEIKKSLSKD